MTQGEWRLPNQHEVSVRCEISTLSWVTAAEVIQIEASGACRHCPGAGLQKARLALVRTGAANESRFGTSLHFRTYTAKLDFIRRSS